MGNNDHVFKFLTLELKPYYTAARNAVDKHTKSLARLKFLQQCLIENLALRELRYRPRLHHGLETNPDQILAWRNNFKISEKSQMTVLHKYDANEDAELSGSGNQIHQFIKSSAAYQPSTPEGGNGESQQKL